MDFRHLPADARKILKNCEINRHLRKQYFAEVQTMVPFRCHEFLYVAPCWHETRLRRMQTACEIAEVRDKEKEIKVKRYGT